LSQKRKKKGPKANKEEKSELKKTLTRKSKKGD